MTTELRKTGIGVVGDVPWGTHFCHFYETKQDLLDTIVPYFKAGLENKEFCLWVVSISELITLEEAARALRQALPDLDRHLAEGSMELVAHDEWFLEGGEFDLHRIINRFKGILDQALNRGYAGMRFNGSSAWMHKKSEREFREFEKELDELINNQRLIVSCTFPLAAAGASEILDAARTHQFAVALRNGDWEVIEAPALKVAKAEVKRLNEELEQRVIERTRELEATNEELKREIAERRRVEEKLRQSEWQLAEAQQLASIGSWNWDLQENILTWSDEHYRILGLQPQEIDPAYESVVREYIHPEDRDLVKSVVENSLKTQEPFDVYYRAVHPNGEVRIIHSRGNVVSDEQEIPVRMFGTAQDVTERMLAQEQLKSSNEKLRALAARLQSVREEESLRIAREIHDELGGALTGLKMDLSWLGNKLLKPDDEAAQQQLKQISGYIDETIQKVRDIATELRPSVLDDLGLAAAIEWQAREFQRRTKIECRIISLEEEIAISAEKSAAVFRILQELLTNAARHARATLIEIIVEEHDDELLLKVSDNGRGIEEHEIADPKSLGLLGLRERAIVFGGRVEIIGTEGAGTTVTVSIPNK